MQMNADKKRRIMIEDLKAGIGWGLAIALGVAALLLSSCQVAVDQAGGFKIGFMQPLHESENTQTTQVTLIGIEVIAANESNGAPSMRLGYVRTQMTSIPAYVPTRDADGTEYSEPTVSISTEAGSEGRIREMFGVGKWEKGNTDEHGQTPTNTDKAGTAGAAPYATGRGGAGAGPTTMTKPLGIEYK